jgi:mRNA interferase MazF
MRRGEVWWANLPPPLGRRPVVLVTRDGVYEVLTSVTAVAVTTRIRDLGVEVFLGEAEGLDRDCVANADNIITVRISQLRQRIGLLSESKISELDRAIKYALDLD